MQLEVAKLFPRADQVRDRIAAIQAAEPEVKAQPLTHNDFEEAISSNKPSASHDNLKRFVQYSEEHGAK